ncbi:MAG: hypothetical protein C0502_02860 [Opitutus sp.]|nr:hypothetical protein [Opitutus sp.]
MHLTTRWVRPEDAGTYGLFLSLVPLGAMLTHAGLIKHFSRHWAGASDRRAYVREWLQAAIPPTGVLLGAIALTAALGLLQPRTGWAAAALFAAAMTGALALAFQLGVQSTARFWTDCGLTTFGSATRTFLPLLAVWLSGGGVSALSGGYVVHAVAYALVSGLAVWHLSPASASASANLPSSSLHSYQTSFFFNGALALINQGIVRWSASLALDDAALGQVTLAASLAAVGPSMASGALWQFCYPRLLAHHRGADRNRMRRFADLMLVVYLGVCALGGVLLAMLLPRLPGTLISAAYLPAIPYVLPLFSFYAGLCGLTLLQGELLVLDRPQSALRFAAGGTALLAGGTAACALLAPTALADWWWLSPAALLPVWIALRRDRGNGEGVTT